MITKDNYALARKWTDIDKFKLDNIYIHYTWRTMFNKLYEDKDRINKIEDEINKTKDNYFYPKPDYIFRAFQMTPLRRLKVVILGQDPYFNHEENIPQAYGLSFSVPIGFQIPSSLKNIYKNLLKYNHIKEIPKHGCLDMWAYQGCLMLNTSLTVIDGKKNCHSKLWCSMTDDIIKWISDNSEYCIFVLWGADALKKLKLINNKHATIISSHPSGLSCNKNMCVYPAFNDVDHFGQINKYLKSKNINGICW